jgi:hypothetical protein
MDVIATPLAFLGLNYYTTLAAAAAAEETDDPERAPGGDQPEGFTEMGWAIEPDGLRDYLGLLNTRYQPNSIVVTENGASYSDGPSDEGVINDQRRIDYVSKHVDAVVAAAEAGVPVDGYFVWSLMDNLEWAMGFHQRFGLVWVDHETQERIPKASYHWYREIVSEESRAARALDTVRHPSTADIGIRLETDPSQGVASERVERWMDGYVLAWSTNDADHIAALFSRDAVYDPQTAEGELLGTDEIVAWWQGIADDPDNWEFDWLPVVETDEVAVVGGRTRYLDPPASYRNLFVIKWGDDGACSDFTEWYIEEEA